MNWESCVKLLNSPTGKTLDRMAKKAAISIALSYVGGIISDDVLSEILNQVSESKQK